MAAATIVRRNMVLGGKSIDTGVGNVLKGGAYKLEIIQFTGAAVDGTSTITTNMASPLFGFSLPYATGSGSVSYATGWDITFSGKVGTLTHDSGTGTSFNGIAFIIGT